MATYRVIEFDSQKFLDEYVERTYLLTKDDVAVARFISAAEASAVRTALNGAAPTEPPVGQQGRKSTIDADALLGFTRSATLYGVSFSTGGFAESNIDGYVYAITFDSNTADGIVTDVNSRGV